MTDLVALTLGVIRERLGRAEDAAVTCQGDGLDKAYIDALEVVSVDAARLLAAVEAVRKIIDAPDWEGFTPVAVSGDAIRTALTAALSATTHQEGTP